MTLDKAKQLCIKAHEGQFRRDGITPYSNHPIEVANVLTTDDEKIVAYLHDILEDTEYVTTKGEKGSWIHLPGELEEAKLAMCWIPERLANTVHLLTKAIVFSYRDYIKAIASNKLATKVKIADITCNLADKPTDRQKVKYTTAMAVLLKEI